MRISNYKSELLGQESFAVRVHEQLRTSLFAVFAFNSKHTNMKMCLSGAQGN